MHTRISLYQFMYHYAWMIDILLSTSTSGPGENDEKCSHLPPVEGGWWRSSSAQQVEGIFVVLVAQLHLSVLAPNAGQVIDILEGNSRRLFENDPGVLDAVVLLVEPGKASPQGEGLSDSLYARQLSASRSE